MTRRAAPKPTRAEKARAALDAALAAKRSRRRRHSAADPLAFEIVGAGEACGSRFDVSGVARALGPADEIEVRNVQA